MGNNKNDDFEVIIPNCDPELESKIHELEYKLEKETDVTLIREYKNQLSIMQSAVKANIIRKEKDITAESGIYFEHDISYAGYSYLVIFGYHANGAYICVPNWSWGCDATDVLDTVMFNQERLMKAGATVNVAEAIARYINKWILDNQSTIHPIRDARNDRIIKYAMTLHSTNI